MAQRAKSKGEKEADQTMANASKIARDAEKVVQADLDAPTVRPEPADRPTGERSHPSA